MLPATDPEAARLVADVLLPGETIVWAGRPDARHTGRIDARLVALGVFWVAVAGAGFYGFAYTLLSDEYGGLPVVIRVALLAIAAAPFVAVAAYCLGGHVVLRRRTRERTAYVITDTRLLEAAPALVWVGRLRVLALDRVAVGRVDVEEHPDGTGDLTISDASGAYTELTFRALRGTNEIVADISVGQRTAGT